MGGPNARVVQAYFISIISPSTVEPLQHLGGLLYFILKHLESIDLFSDLRSREVLDESFEGI